MKHLIALLMILLLLPAAGTAQGVSEEVKIVGEEILFEEVTDFYYTVDASTFPPYYQRYRLYTEDGTHFFYHETREGGGWPQTEENITRSGTKELGEDQWVRNISQTAMPDRGCIFIGRAVRRKAGNSSLHPGKRKCCLRRCVRK